MEDYDFDALGIGIGDSIARGPVRSRRLRNQQPGSDQITNVPQADVAGYAQRARDFQEQASALQSQAPDVAGYQQMARQRSEEGANALTLAIAAQRAGPQFEQLGGSYLKRAMEARNPMSAGKAGMITPEGEFVADPTFGREQRISQLMQQAQKYDALAVQAQTAQEKAALQQQAAQDRAQAKQQQMALQASIFGMRQDARQENMALRRERNEQTDSMQRMRIEDSMANSFTQATKDLEQELVATRKVSQLAPSMLGRRPNAIEQQSMIVLLNRFLDPDSVVREGEFNRVAQAQGLIQQAQNLSNRIGHGELMSDKLVAQIVQMSNFYEQAARAKMQRIGDQYSTLAQQRGLRPDAIVRTPEYRPGQSPGFSMRRLD